MNILTFDIEEWYFEKAFRGGRAEKYREYEDFLSRILDLLDERNVKGTFFCVGKMATDFPQVVRHIQERGHEIGCHSHIHTWLNKMSREVAFDDTRQAVDALEQCIGQKIKSYRAPAFSIGKQNEWAFEVLAMCGIERDASVYPAARDFGGFADFGHRTPTLLRIGDVTMKEFPVCTTHLFGQEMAYSGGGYFRFFPLWFVKKTMAKNDYNMCYFHIGDLIPEHRGVMTKAEYEDYFKEPGTLFNRYKRYLKSNLGKDTAFSKMVSLISSMNFVNMETADSIIDWEKATTINLG